MARNRASMREGPLAELFRATEAAKRGGQDDANEQQQLPTEPEPATKAAEPEPPEHAVVRHELPEPGPDPRQWPRTHGRRRPHSGPHGSPTRRYKRPGRSVQPA